MARQIINIGAAPNDGLGEEARSAFNKINLMTEELYAGMGGGNVYAMIQQLGQNWHTNPPARPTGAAFVYWKGWQDISELGPLGQNSPMAANDEFLLIQEPEEQPDPSAPVVISDGTIAGAPEIGNTLTVENFTYSGYPTPTLEFAWQRNGVDILGATSESYTVQSADDGASVRRRTTLTNTSGSVVSDTPTVAIAYPAPELIASISDQTFTQASGDQTVDAAAAFSGAVGGAFSVNSVAGVSINTSTGQVTISTTNLLVSTQVDVTYTNSGGAETVSFFVLVTASATVPAQMTAGQWDLVNNENSGQLEVTVLSAPSNGGSAITDYQVRVASGEGFGEPISLGISAPGSAILTGLTDGQPYEVEIRAVNGVGPAVDWSLPKQDTPSSSTGGLPDVNWFAAFDASALSLANGDPVDSWPSLVGTRTFEATLGDRPIFTSATALLNGQPSLRFQSSQNRRMTGSFGGKSRPVTLVLIWAPETQTHEGRILYQHSDILATQVNTGGDYRKRDGGSATQVNIAHTSNLSPAILDMSVYRETSSASNRFWLNGVERGIGQQSGSSSTNLRPGTLYLGNNNDKDRPANGYVAFFGIIDGIVTDEERTEIENWAVSRFGVVLGEVIP